MRRPLRPAVLWTAIPFALLANSAQVRMTLEIRGDGSARRIIGADVAPYFKDQVPKWINDVQAGHAWDRVWKGDTGTTYFYGRDYATQSPRQAAVNGELRIEDVFQKPLSIYTTYNWREEVTFSYLYPTDPSAASASGKQLIYEVKMPGVVTDATVKPGKIGGTQSKPAALPPVARSAAPGLEALLFGVANAQPAAPVPADPATPPPPTATPGPAATQATPAPSTGPVAPAPAPVGGKTPEPAAAPAPPSEPAPKRAVSTVETEGNSAIFKLDASQETVVVDVTSRRVRWSYLAIVAYVLAFVVFKLLEGLQRAARLRPRKI